MKLGIGLVPCAATINSIVALQNEIISTYPLQPQLGTNSNLPHITLLQGRFREPIDWNSFLIELGHYCQSQSQSLEFMITGVEFQPPNWYFLKLSHNNFIVNAHKFVFEKLKKLLFLTEEDFQKDLTGYSSEEKLNYLQYGYRYVGECFRPHITLGRFTAHSGVKSPTDLIHLTKLESFNCLGKLQTITVYQMGENGSHAKTLYYLNLINI